MIVNANPFQPALDVLAGNADVAVMTAGHLDFFSIIYNVPVDSFEVLGGKSKVLGMPYDYSSDTFPGAAISALRHVPYEVPISFATL